MSKYTERICGNSDCRKISKPLKNKNEHICPKCGNAYIWDSKSKTWNEK